MLRVRWIGRVAYREVLALQTALFKHGREQHLLLLEHPHVFTYGPRAELDKNLKCDPSEVGADFVAVKRGGDITYHGPGQLVGYPILNLENAIGATAHVCSVEQLVIDTLTELGVKNAGRLTGFAGVWLDADNDRRRKISAIGVRLAHGRTMHGFALNVDPDMTYMRQHIVPCGVAEYPVTSLKEEGINVSMQDVVKIVSRLAIERWGGGEAEQQEVAWVHRPEDLSRFSRGEGPGEPVRMLGRLADAGVDGGVDLSERKPEWLRPKVQIGPEVLKIKRTLSELKLVTVCEEAGCPNLSECWKDGTATFMVLGERCTRACGFCLVDTRKPELPEADEPQRVAEAVASMGLTHAVLTMVARDDLADGGFAHVAECVRAIRERNPLTRIETLVSDAKGDVTSLQLLFDARPDVFNHNIETVTRLQRAVRPSAGYARSLGVLSAAKAAGLVVKSGLVLGMGETSEEVDGCLADLAGIGVNIVTIGQYLRPTTHHTPVARWIQPDEFSRWKQVGESLGIGHVESSPLTRSSYHAKQSADAAGEAVSVTLSRVAKS
ncbi:MAG: octanoyltransferase/lipoyl synthase [Actinomycetota bacterium]